MMSGKEWEKGVESSFTQSAMEDASWSLILNTKKKGMKFKKTIIIFGELTNWN